MQLKKNRHTLNKLQAISYQQAYDNQTLLCDCTGSVWDRVNFLHSSRYGAVFWICDENSASNTPVF